MRKPSLWARLLGVEGAIVESVEMDRSGVLVAQIRPPARERRRPRCPDCGRVCPRYDAGRERRWRALDLGFVRAFVEAHAPRVRCAEHGVRTAKVSWARHRSGFTRAFEDTVAWLVTQCSKSGVGELLRLGWRTVGRIIERVVAEADPAARLKNVRRIGIDEISYRKGHRYLTVVVDHDTGKLLWAANGHDEATLSKFFEMLGPEGCAQIELVSADAAAWIRNAVRRGCPEATLCMDPFHVVSWATKALDQVRRDVWNTARKAGQRASAKAVKGARYALWKNPDDLTLKQKATLAAISKTNRPLYRAYLLKEQLRQVFRLRGEAGKRLLDRWLAWAQRCRLKPFVKVGRSIKRMRTEIDAVLTHGLTNARVEGLNTRLRLITRRAFGFHSAEAIIALGLLSLGGLAPCLPGRSP
ncbi:MAG: ISL3 family transposase [bacterium]|nr:ISL3 family transposase [bacterium]MCP4437301.1 ISL3 family transposase [Actinomycetes bacterium]MCP4915809.1 ISL3 family transposase [Pseudomonadota bacterium]